MENNYWRRTATAAAPKRTERGVGNFDLLAECGVRELIFERCALHVGGGWRWRADAVEEPTDTSRWALFRSEAVSGAA